MTEPGGDPDSVVLDSVTARELTRQIRVALEHSYTLIIAAWKGRAWESLGYKTWDAYVQGEFGTLALQPPREERPAIVMSMRDAGMSVRAIMSATGLGRGTVGRELEKPPGLSLAAPIGGGGVPNGTPEEQSPLRVVGRDGKSYPASSARSTLPDVRLFEDVPLSDELLALPPSEMGIAVLTPSALTSRGVRERKAATKRLTGSAASPLPMVIRLAGEITLDPGALTVEEDSDTKALSGLAADVSRGVLALSHVLTSIDAAVFSSDAGDSVALGAVVTDAVDELGRFLDALHSRKHLA
ncbi:hypothetical protein ACX801_18030 [Arthrobacter bambusae]